jgi:microcompartment protein CcmK/EutM
MKIARVIGSVVSTIKYEVFQGAKLLLVQPLGLDLQPQGRVLLAADGVGAGAGELVLICQEGRSSRQALRLPDGPVGVAVVAIIDELDMEIRKLGN